MEKIINLEGRIDSTNATSVEEKINNEIGAFNGEIVLDAEKLEYISSAGLRIILRLKNKNTNTKIINCNSEIYEIFDMTGFVEILDISKAYKNISIDGCERIGEGANGIVYRIDPDTIVKVYKNKDSLPEICTEREMARKAFVMQIPTAISYDIVKVGDLYGSVFELLNAKAYAELLNEGYSVEKLVDESVKVLKKIHSTKLKEGELPSRKEFFVNLLTKNLEYFDEKEGKQLLKLFEEIPETGTMLHGDYHVKNIMMQNNETLLIDMATLSVGHPIFEFAGIFSTYEGFSCVKEGSPAEFLGISKENCEEFLRKTFEKYFEDKDQEYIDDVLTKAKLIAYTRIMLRSIKKYGIDAKEYTHVIDFCKKYINDNVFKVEKLSF